METTIFFAKCTACVGIWCLVAKNKMHSPLPSSPQLRTVAQMQAENDKFLLMHQGDKKAAARCYNCRHLPLLPIQLENVSPPYLHILLGLTLRHHRLLEAAAHAVDIKIHEEIDDRLTDFGLFFKKFGGNWKLVLDTRSKLRTLKTSAALSNTYSDKAHYKQQIADTKQVLSGIQHNEVTLQLHATHCRHKTSSFRHQTQ